MVTTANGTEAFLHISVSKDKRVQGMLSQIPGRRGPNPVWSLGDVVLILFGHTILYSLVSVFLVCPFSSPLLLFSHQVFHGISLNYGYKSHVLQQEPKLSWEPAPVYKPWLCQIAASFILLISLNKNNKYITHNIMENKEPFLFPSASSTSFSAPWIQDMGNWDALLRTWARRGWRSFTPSSLRANTLQTTACSVTYACILITS